MGIRSVTDGVCKTAFLILQGLGMLTDSSPIHYFDSNTSFFSGKTPFRRLCSFGRV